MQPHWSQVLPSRDVLKVEPASGHIMIITNITATTVSNASVKSLDKTDLQRLVLKFVLTFDFELKYFKVKLNAKLFFTI